MTSRLARLTEGLAGITLTVGLLVGPPWLLITQVGPPIPASWPDLDSLRTITAVGVTDSFIITTLAVIVWITWAQLALAITTELIAKIRHRPPIRIPLLPGTQPLAARLVAATLLLVTALQPRPVATATPLNAAVATVPTAIVDDQPAATPQAPTADRTAVQTPTRTITVGERDSWWSLAESHLDDGIRWRELRDLNLHRTLRDGTVVRASTDQLQAGWDLLVPAAGEAPDAADTSLPPNGTGEQATVTIEVAESWTVTDGDHFWGKAADTLEQAWDRTPTDQEIVPYWRELIDINRDRLAPPGDPDLIHPGQQFEIPTPPTDPDGGSPPLADPIEEQPDHQPEVEAQHDGVAEPAPDAADDQTPRGQQEPSLMEESQPAPGGGDEVPELPPDAAGGTAGGLGGPAEEAPGEGARTAEDGAASTRDADEGTAQGQAPLSGWERTLAGPDAPGDQAQRVARASDQGTFESRSRLAPGVAAAGLAGAGIAALVRRRRQIALQQRPVGSRLPTPAPDTLDHLHRLELAAPGDDEELGPLVGLLSTIPPSTRPALVTLADDGTVRLLFPDDVDPGAAVEPWQVAPTPDHEPQGWVARIGHSGPARSIGLPLLVTLGRTDGQLVLGNLGCVRTLAVCGPAGLVGQALHAATLEVATSRTAGPLQVAVLGADTHPGLDQAHTVADLTTVLTTANSERDQDIIDEDRTVQLVVAHRGTSLPEELTTITDPLLGILHAAARPATNGWSITLNDADTATLQLPDGGTVTLQRPEIDSTLIHDELDRHDRVEDAPEAIIDVDQEHPTPAPDVVDGNGHHPADETDPAAPVDLPEPAPTSTPHPAIVANGHSEPVVGAEPPSLEVRVLGPVEVLRDGEALTDLSPQSLHILVYLATHRDGVTPERLDDVIWNGHRAAPTSQRLRSALTKLRDSLGDGPDGEPLLPRRQGRADPVQLAGTVTTDFDLAISQLEHARLVHGDQRLTHLDAALAHVRGEPFAGWPLSWASEITERAIATLQDAAAAAAAGHRRRTDYERAEQAILTGLQLCDPNETLYLEWARLEAARGRPDQITRIQRRLRAAYAHHEDEIAVEGGSPTPATLAAFRQLQERIEP